MPAAFPQPGRPPAATEGPEVPRRNAMERLRRVRRNGRWRSSTVIHGSIEREYWRTRYNSRDYVDHSQGFRDYEPAFRYGWELRAGYGGQEWSELEPKAAAGWERFRGDCSLGWGDAAPAVREAYERAGRPFVPAA